MTRLLRGEFETPESPVRIEHLLVGARNDCEPVVREMHPEVGEAIDWLSRHSGARMTGTGSAVFAPFASRARAVEVSAEAPAPWRGLVARGLNRSPCSTSGADPRRGNRARPLRSTLGCSQAVRHGTLTPAFPGSNPGTQPIKLALASQPSGGRFSQAIKRPNRQDDWHRRIARLTKRRQDGWGVASAARTAAGRFVEHECLPRVLQLAGARFHRRPFHLQVLYRAWLFQYRNDTRNRLGTTSGSDQMAGNPMIGKNFS